LEGLIELKNGFNKRKKIKRMRKLKNKTIEILIEG
jgi:hypothetical protein